VAKYGPEAVKPWITSFNMAGSVVPKLDPYFSLGKAVEMYMTSYANLGIQYEAVGNDAGFARSAWQVQQWILSLDQGESNE
jgi:hypothetical protein